MKQKINNFSRKALIILAFSSTPSIIYAIETNIFTDPYKNIVIDNAIPTLSPGCQIILASPTNQAIEVPTNVDIVVRITKTHLGNCGPIQLIHQPTGNVENTKTNYHHQWNSYWRRSPLFIPRILDDRIVQEFSLRPSQNLQPGEQYSIVVNQQTISTFTVHPQGKYRGQWLAIQPSIPQIPSILPAQEIISKSTFNKILPTHVQDILANNSDLYQEENAKKQKNFQLDSERMMTQKERQTKDVKSKVILDLIKSNVPHIYDLNAPYDVRYLRLLYNSVDPNGTLQEESALLVLPYSIGNQEVNYAEMPIMLLEHTWPVTDTTPSEGTSFETIVSGILAARGFIVILSDHLGLGRTKKCINNRFVTRGIVSDSYDALQATREYFMEQYAITLNPHLWVSGASKGALFAGFLLEYLLQKKELVDHFYGYAGPYDYYGSFYSTVSYMAGESDANSPFLEYPLARVGHQVDDMIDYFKGAVAYDNAEGEVMYDLRDPKDAKIFSIPMLRKLLNLHYPHIHYHIVMATLSDTFSSYIPETTHLWLYHPKRDSYVSSYNSQLMAKKLIAYAREPENIHIASCRDYSSITIGLYAIALWKNNDLVKHLQCYPYMLDDIVTRHLQQYPSISSTTAH